MVHPCQSPGQSGGIVQVALAQLDAVLSLIQAGGPEAATTRAVAALATVQVPTIYRLFGDKHALLDATAERSLAVYIAAKTERVPHLDPIAELRHGWDNPCRVWTGSPRTFFDYEQQRA